MLTKICVHYFTMKMIKLLLLIIYVHEIVSLKTYYVIPGCYSDENETKTAVNISWADICHHISRYFTSCTEIILNPSIYYMELYNMLYNCSFKFQNNRIIRRNTKLDKIFHNQFVHFSAKM